ncbi:MAG TPA: hypothetical protein PLV50_13445 [Smithella sp.]|nr:hypothetical protein [Smithella sp.]HNY51329.1 hypothetical protein [Smithella sp.]HOG91541.1 hypothetical protein [Smithella sp.]
MSIIKGILKEELARLEDLCVFYEKKLSEFPRGSISVKERNGKRYIYLARREDKKVVFKYIGKDIPEVRNVLNEQLRQRKEFQSKLRQAKDDLKEVKRSLRGKRT